MNTLAIRIAMSVHAALEAKLVRWEELNGTSVYDITDGCGEWERQEIILDAAQAVDYDAIQAKHSNATAIEIVYAVSELLTTVFCEQFDEYAGFGSTAAAFVVDHANKHGLLKV
jgi:hypothetical protein